MNIAFLEPHLSCYGGIRRVVEFGNRLVGRGHQVTFLLPPGAKLECSWMPCQAEIRYLETAYDEAFDVLIFNHEPQWYLLSKFTRATARVFYALHYAALYEKAGVYESLRLPVDLRLANSSWTADCVEKEAGPRPEVLLGGINPDHFRPVSCRKRYPVLAYGDRRRDWKGTKDIEAACERLGLPLHRYAGKGYSQEKMASVYGAAEVFVTGSWFEGFCQPGLEALACGTPLVTTDCGGAREYAIHEETALVVPPRDPGAMADAIARLRGDEALRNRMRQAGLALVKERFDWDRNTERLEQHLEAAVAKASRNAVPGSPLTERPSTPTLSVIALAWDGLDLTQAFVESVRRHTDVDYELILVDNGSQPLARDYVEAAADHAILNETNQGFAGGMNQGLAAARGRFIAFMNNDTRVPKGWASKVLGGFETHKSAGLVAPVVTSGGSEISIRETPGERVLVLPPFGDPPAAVAFVMPAEVARGLGGFGEEYPVASAEDVDLCFKVWANGLEILIDERVLVFHHSKGTASSKLEDWEETWEDHRQIFLKKWCDEHVQVPSLGRVPDEEFDRLRRCAVGAAQWMRRYFWALDVLRGGEKKKERRRAVRKGERPAQWRRTSSGRRRFLEKKLNSVRKRLKWRS